MKMRALRGGLVALCVIAAAGSAGWAHDDARGRPHFKGVRANPTAVMRALAADAQAAQVLAAASDFACVDGFADIYPCENVDLLAFVPLAELGSGPVGAANDIWGWTDSASGREFALVGLNSGTAFVEITDPLNPVFLGTLPTHTEASSWRDIKVRGDHAFIVSQADGHGMQVFDLTRLLSANPADADLPFSDDGQYNGFGSAHNLVVNEVTAYAFAVGAETCAGGLHMIDLSVPTAPADAGCFSADGYTHDAQCVVYAGPDTAHQGDDICFASNKNTLTIVDVTDKGAPVQLSRTGYPDRRYTHQAWLDETHALLFLGDELDEYYLGHNTRTHVWDVSDLESPSLIDEFFNVTSAIDHNQYVKGDLVFQANYRSGLSVLRLLRDTGGVYAGLEEVGFFDVYPASDSANFNGAWSTFPYFPSGTIVVSGIEQGLFVLALNIADEILIAAPAAGAVLGGTAVPIDIFARDGDFDVVGVVWRVNQGTWQATASAGADTYTALWDISNLGDGAYALSAEMTDGEGNVTGTSISVTIASNDDPPTAAFIAPDDGAEVSKTVTLEAAAGDDSAVVSVTFFDDGQAIGTDADSAGGWTLAWNTRKVDLGEHRLTVQAEDDAGQLSDLTAAGAAITVTVVSGKGGGDGGGPKKCNPRRDPDCTR